MALGGVGWSLQVEKEERREEKRRGERLWIFEFSMARLKDFLSLLRAIDQISGHDLPPVEFSSV